MLSFLVRTSLAASLLIPTVGFSYDSFYRHFSCEVPVCDVQETIAQLRKMNGDQRGQFALNLKNQYKDAVDQKVLQNLRETGLQLKALTKELGDEDWVQRVAGELVTSAVFNLAKITTDGQEMAGY